MQFLLASRLKIKMWGAASPCSCMSCKIIAILQPLTLNMLKGLLQKFRSRDIGNGDWFLTDLQFDGFFLLYSSRFNDPRLSVEPLVCVLVPTLVSQGAFSSSICWKDEYIMHEECLVYSNQGSHKLKVMQIEHPWVNRHMLILCAY
jgi:hypothetical protein